MKKLVFSLGTALLVVALAILVLWANDVRSDRRHTVTFDSAVTIFGGNGTNQCDRSERLTTVEAGTIARVRRIRYWKDCATVDISLPDGRQGYIVLGVGGEVSIDPPIFP